MKILLSTYGSLGDIHPFIALALELQKRGHEPVFATSEKYRPKIEGESLQFRPIRPDLPADDELGAMIRQVMDLKTGTQYLFQKLLMPPLRQSYADLVEAGADCDLILSHPAAPATPLAARKLRKKWLSTALAPISLWSKFDPPVPPTMPHLEFLRRGGPLVNQAFLQIAKTVTRRWCAELDNLNRDEGLRDAGHPMFEGQYSPFGTLALFSPLLFGPQKDWPVNTIATGFCFYDKTGFKSEISPSCQQFLETGEAPIIFTLGSSAVFDAGNFYWKSAQIASEYEKRALLLVGKNLDAYPSEKLPPGILAVEYAPYSEVFPRACLIVHQGGIGTTAQALRAGVPQIVMPYAHDQPDNAARLRRLGVGQISTRRHYPGQAFELMLDLQVDVADSAEARRARAIGEKIRAENGPQAACEAIERLIG